MKYYFSKSVAVCLSIMAITIFSKIANAGDDPNIFDWNVAGITEAEGLTPVPHPFFWEEADWQAVYDDQFTNSSIIAVMLRNTTGPYDGSTDTEALDKVMTYLDTNSYYLNFVFADFESDTKDLNTEEMVDQVRAHSNLSINNAYVGNYQDYPGATDYSDLWGVYDRTARHNLYTNSGLDVAMPSIYPYTAYRNHAVRNDIFGSNLCVSIAHALFWTPLERYSTAKNNLPTGHMIIPWAGGLVQNVGYEAPIPSKAECRALLQHVRLRGANGYYTWANGANTNYISRADYCDDMYANAWKPLDWFFNYPVKNEILNLTTNKTGGVEWSGMRRGNRCMFIISNYTTSSAQVDLPDTIENIPDLSPSVAAGEHLVMDYVIGPLSNWKLDENTGSDTYDEMDAENDGTISGATWASGKSGNALTFDGTDDGVNFGDVLDMGTNDRSISLWFKTTTNDGTYRALLSKGYSTTNNQHAISLLNGKIYCLMDVSGTDRVINTGVTVNDGNWHHLAITIKRTDKMKLYLDGVEKTSVNISADSAVDAQDTRGFYLGRSHSGQYFNGSIDEVKIFSGVISEQEIYDEYNTAILNVRLDERQSTTAYDESILANDGTVSGATWSNGNFGSALTFDGTDDGVNFGDILDMGTNDRSISLWFKTTTNDGNYHTLLSKGYSATTNQHSISLLNGKIHCIMDVSGTDRVVNTGVTVNDDEWHHIILTIDRDDTMKLYLDGTQKASVDISADSAVDAQDTRGFYLGRSHSGQYFPGSIDELKIYDKALDATQVTQLNESYN
jgi:Concanavalin A-like lectin/glucanases superfamily